ncbi:MAG: energy-coupling factor ABC transporter permease [Patescibacteria group bacterium]|jgi:cobalamin biosynthesis protein CbiM
MHIPDGFLNNQTSVSLIVVAIGFCGLAFKKAKEFLFEKNKLLLPQLMTNIGLGLNQPRLVDRLILKQNANKKIQQMAVVAAFVFAAQMVNFPVTNGTSGHLFGGVLAAIVLGPWLGMLVICAVLLVQSLIFGDGGVLALGANIFNMAVIGAIGGYYLYLLVKKIIKNQTLVIALISWFSVVLAATACSFELAVSKTISLNLVLPAMLSVHALIGIGEALITVFALKFLFNDDKKY